MRQTKRILAFLTDCICMLVLFPGAVFAQDNGDSRDITLWLAALLMTSTVLTGTAVFGRRKRKYSE